MRSSACDPRARRRARRRSRRCAPGRRTGRRGAGGGAGRAPAGRAHPGADPSLGRDRQAGAATATSRRHRCHASTELGVIDITPGRTRAPARAEVHRLRELGAALAELALAAVARSACGSRSAACGRRITVDAVARVRRGERADARRGRPRARGARRAAVGPRHEDGSAPSQSSSRSSASRTPQWSSGSSGTSPPRSRAGAARAAVGADDGEIDPAAEPLRRCRRHRTDGRGRDGAASPRGRANRCAYQCTACSNDRGSSGSSPGGKRHGAWRGGRRACARCGRRRGTARGPGRGSPDRRSQTRRGTRSRAGGGTVVARRSRYGVTFGVGAGSTRGDRSRLRRVDTAP